ncbi:MAG: LegC family aminotransferase [Bacteroidetes bacterium]|nr:LegC family aminotransferase [Bacteroidota bacterium]
MYKDTVDYIRNIFHTKETISLHAPLFIGNEKKYVNDCIDSTFVSSAGKYVNEFEKNIATYTGSKYAIATVNGTAALHIALLLAGVKKEDEVITQALSFVATSNAINYTGANPVFLDVDKSTLGLSPDKLNFFLERNTEIKKDGCYNIKSGKRISACVPMHTFGFPCRIQEIIDVCAKYNIPVVEDAAESIGSSYKGKHTGTFGLLGTLSFNGNKIITCGGGGAIITDNEALAKLAKHITTTAKQPHAWEYIHDMIGYNYRMPNINAALACAQLEQLNFFIEKKRELAKKYKLFFEKTNIKFITEPENCKANYWLNCICLESRKERDDFLKYSNENGVMTRPVWKLTNKLTMYQSCQTDSLENSQWIEDRIVNLPSSMIL